MNTKVAINGLGRIGRAILKLAIDEPAIELVAVNDLVDVENLAYLLRFDTVYGRYSKPVVIDGADLVVAGRKLRTLCSRDPSDLPWKELGVELVFECTGAHTRREDLEKHVRAGARFVLLSAPSKDEGVETVVHGVNVPGGTRAITSCASCTTNCITPIVEVIGRRIGFQKAVNFHTIAAWSLVGLWVFAIFWHFTTGEWKQYIPTTEKVVARASRPVLVVPKQGLHPAKKAA